MTTNYESQVNVINDLIVMNNDRVQGYEYATTETEDVALKRVFEQFAQQSREYATILSSEVRKLGGEASTSTSTSGKFYRAWMEIRSALSGKDAKAVLSSCEYGEDVILEAYEEALNSESTLTSDLRELITTQKEELEESHDTVKSLRETDLVSH